MVLFQQIMSTFGAAIMLPILIFVFEILFLKVKPGQALKSALYIGVGLNALVSILNPFFLGLMGEAVTEMITTGGIQLPYVDTGWGVLSALTYSTTIGAAIIPVGILVNVLLLRLGLSETLDLDVWNFWQWAFVGTLIYYKTGNYFLGLAAAVLMELICLFLADLAGPSMRSFFNLPNLSFPHGSMISGTLIALIFRWPLEKLGVMKLKVNSESIRKRFGPFGDAVVMGFIVSLVIGLIAWSGKLGDMVTWGKILKLGVGTGGFIYLYPKATAALLEGFQVLSDSIRDILSRRGSQREINFGMDGALTVGHPDSITTGLLSMIIAVLLVFFLPGNRFLMLADLGVTPFFLAAGIVAIMGGNIIASVITTTISLIITLYFSTWISPVFNTIATKIGGIDVVHGAALVGADIRPIAGISYYAGGQWLTLIGGIILMLGLMYLVKRHPKIREKITGFAEDTQA